MQQLRNGLPPCSNPPVLVTDAEKADAPANFVTVPAKGKGLENYSYRMQLSPYDCLGCGVCTTVCPMKEKGALVMVPMQDEVDQQDNFNEYAMKEKYLKKEVVSDSNVKAAQFAKPYFQFSPACGGCAETTYIKTVTQLFGSRMYIANASGCSSAYGGSLPMTPYCKDERGFGPCWEQSLFEDNAEFAYGYFHAQDAIQKEIIIRLNTLKEQNICTAEIEAYLAAYQDGKKSVKYQMLSSLLSKKQNRQKKLNSSSRTVNSLLRSPYGLSAATAGLTISASAVLTM